MAERPSANSGRSIAFGVDATRVTRPGVPRERNAPDPGAWWDRPEQQHGTGALSSQGIRTATPVFGTGPPPRALSGLVRRVAYGFPEHRAARWLLLVAGDRIDVLEHRIARNAWLVPASLALAGGYLLAARALARR
jgi:hypothetical protein